MTDLPLLNAAGWDAFLDAYPDAHLLQTAAWGELKSHFGWYPRRLAIGATGVQVLFRRLPLGFTVGYIPRGPVGPDWSELRPALDRLCRRERAVLLKVEPEAWEPLPAGWIQDNLPGFRSSPQTIQAPRTVVVDLEGEEERTLARMKPKTRYNIRLAEKKEVQVHPSSDLEGFYALMSVTGQRDAFGVHSLDYYRRVYDLFHPDGACELLQAEYSGQPLAALMVFGRGNWAWYFYGASNNLERNRMPAYLLQWEAMRWARQRGCRFYDLWGIPDEEEGVLEAEFEKRSSELWGVYRFKRGFGGQVRRTAGAYDRVYIPGLHAFYRWWARRRGIS